MRVIDLNGRWTLSTEGTVLCEGNVPGSVYSFLLDAGLMENPFYRENELQALALMERDYTFSRSFKADAGLIACGRVVLCCEGLDTLCRIELNGQTLGTADNMHCAWEFDVKPYLRNGENRLALHFSSPTRYIENAWKADPIGGSRHAMTGFPHLRKAHCMFGWDWGPRLPDAGIWKSIFIEACDNAKIADAVIRQHHTKHGVEVTVRVQGKIVLPAAYWAVCTLEGPNGFFSECKKQLTEDGATCVDFIVKEPRLWWPNGYGEHPLYTLKIRLEDEKFQKLDEKRLRIGLRTLTVSREKDCYGEEFAFQVNGVKIFSMGADYIPEDNILSRVTPERTQLLLEQCAIANFNSIRVWGGGYYPDDTFFDVCDELGLIVWQDFMFACACYRLTEAFEESIRREITENIRRIRHHACLGLWCGNNEMEMFQIKGTYGADCKTRSDYIRMFEHIIPEILRKEDPDTFYWPASPSSGGCFDEPNSPDRGDVHYWEVWHGGKPFAEYRKFFFRYASEFGFQAFPSMKTIESFTLPEERNIFSRVMEMHQRNEGANGKIMAYLSETYLYPHDLDTLVYASQLLQANAVRYGVEHWRRNRGRCMGAIYWQLNDIWPGASWASVDYFGRWKALHYYAKRFFAPVMISGEEAGENTARMSVVEQPSAFENSVRLNVANETREEILGVVRWTLRDARNKVLQRGERKLTIPALSAQWLEKIVFDSIDHTSNYFSYEFFVQDEMKSSGTVLFTAPKHYRFEKPHLEYRLEGRHIEVSSDVFAKDVEISAQDPELLLSDNYFDLCGKSKIVEILRGNPNGLRLRSVYDIR